MYGCAPNTSGRFFKSFHPATTLLTGKFAAPPAEIPDSLSPTTTSTPNHAATPPPLCSGFIRTPSSGLALIQPSRCIRLEHPADFIADATKNKQLFILTARGMSRIIKPPMMPVHLPRKHRTDLTGISTHGDHRLHIAGKKFIKVLGMMVTDIETDLGHYFDGQRVDVTRRV